MHHRRQPPRVGVMKLIERVRPAERSKERAELYLFTGKRSIENSLKGTRQDAWPQYRHQRESPQGVSPHSYIERQLCGPLETWFPVAPKTALAAPRPQYRLSKKSSANGTPILLHHAAPTVEITHIALGLRGQGELRAHLQRSLVRRHDVAITPPHHRHP